MGRDYHPVSGELGVVMSPIQSEKKRIKPAPVYSFTWLDVIVVLISMGTYIADIVTDILVTLVYWKLDEKIWAGLTLAFLIIPSIITQIFSTRWYMADGHKITLPMIVAHLMMMGPIQRYVKVLKFGFRARKTKGIEDYQAMYSQLSDVSMLRLFESFLESAPQLVLQLYIMIEVTEGDHILTGIAAFFSLISLSWAIAAYTKALRTAAFSQDNRKKRVSWSGLILQTLWRVGMVAGRIVALVLFATIYPVWLLVGVAVHWFIMTVWLVAQDTDFCGSWWEERLFNAVVGVIHIFCFFNMKEGRSRWRMVGFYVITLAENSAMILLWFPHRTVGMWFNVPALITVWGGFIVGIISMVVYYQYFHPSSPKKCHCCMLYYHLIYRCCPCDGITTFNATPYRRNVAVPESFSESDSGESDCDKYRPVSGVYEQDDDVFGAPPRNKPTERGIHVEKAVLDIVYENGKHLDQEKKVSYHGQGDRGAAGKSPAAKKYFSSKIYGDQDGNVRLTKIKSINSPDRGGKKKLLMPKPKATSTPGDDLDEKRDVIVRQPWKQNHDEVELDDLSSFVSPRSNPKDATLADVDRDEFFLEQKKLLRNDIDPLTSTPSVLKNLPGASNGPCTNKGNSTLVREWVKKTQDIYENPTLGVKRGVSFHITEEARSGADFGTLGSAVRHATKDEREFMQAHFGRIKDAQPSGRRDILRMKSFGKKERQKQPAPKMRGKKRRRPSHNLVDLRNSFREAFGFHSVDVDQVQEHQSHDGNAKRRDGENGKIADPDWPETDIDEGPEQRLIEETRARHTREPKKSAEKRMNVILARIDQPPEDGACLTKKQPWSKKWRDDQRCDPTMFNVDQAGKYNPRDGVLQPLAVMENLHGTAAPSMPVVDYPVSAELLDAPGPGDPPNPEVDQHTTEYQPTQSDVHNDEGCMPPALSKLLDRPGNTPYPAAAGLLNPDSEKSVVQPTNADNSSQFGSTDEETVVPAGMIHGEREMLIVNDQENVRLLAETDEKLMKKSGPNKAAHPSHETEPRQTRDEKNVRHSSKLMWKKPFLADTETASDAAAEHSAAGKVPVVDVGSSDTGPAGNSLYKTCESKIFSAEKSVYDNVQASTTETDTAVSLEARESDADTLAPQVNANTQFGAESALERFQPKPATGDVFGPVIRVTGGGVTVTHRDDSKTQLISKPAQENEPKPAYNVVRRDRIEYLYKIGRHGLKLAAQNSPARKRLSFKQENGEYLVWSSDEENAERCDFHTENELQKFGESEIFTVKPKPAKRSTQKDQERDKKMEKSIEALGKSMEGVIDGDDNYKIHIRDTGQRKSQNKTKSKKTTTKKSSKSLEIQKYFIASKQHVKKEEKPTKVPRKRKTLGAIENRNII